MAFYYSEPSHTFSEYLLVPGYTSAECVPDRVSLKTPLVRYRRGQEECPLSLNIPMVSAIMQSVSNDTLAIALAKEGGLSFIYGSQSIESEAEMVRRVKTNKAGFVVSASNLTPDHTLADVLALKEKNGFSTVAITEDATPNGKLLGIVTSRDYRVTRMSPDLPVREFMTPREKLITAPAATSLKEANNIIWDHKLNSLPIVDEEDHLLYFVFRKDYAEHKEHPLALQDADKRYCVGAGINSRDYAERVPALVEAGADVLCIDSSEGYSFWQKNTIDWIRAKYGHSVRVGAGNVVDRDGFRFLAECGADFVKVGIGGGSICITRETKGIGRGQATALIEVAAVGADGDIDAGFLKILVPLGGHIDHGCGLTAADALGLAGDADGAAANANLHKVGAGVCQETEALAIHHVAGAYLDRVAILGANPLKAVLLPIGIALGGVHDQHVHTGVHQRGHPLLVVTGVDARAHHVALLAVQQLQRIALVGIVVLAEHKAHQMTVLRENRQGVELVVPDNVIGDFQAGALRCVDELLHRRHEIRHLGVGVHAADPVITAGDQTQHLAGAGAVIRDSHGGVAGALLQSQHIRQSIRHPEVGIADDEARLVVLDPADHGRLRLNGLGDINKGNAALLG